MNDTPAKNWYVIKTLSRAEKKTAERLTDTDYQVYLPLQTTIKQWSDRKKKVEVPLIPGVIFVYCVENALIKLYNFQGVYSILKLSGKFAIVRENEIKNLKLLLKDHIELEEEDFETVSKGELVEVIQGPLQGIIATSIEQQRNYKLIIQFESIGRQFVFHIPRSQVRKIKEKSPNL